MSTQPGPRESLIQYEEPIEINQAAETGKGQQGAGGLKKKGVNLPPLETKPSTDDILNAILPPREWDQEGKHYIQYVSHNSASREDVANLQKLLDERLLARQARF
jgi:dynein light intermediate chain